VVTREVRWGASETLVGSASTRVDVPGNTCGARGGGGTCDELGMAIPPALQAVVAVARRCQQVSAWLPSSPAHPTSFSARVPASVTD